MTTFDAVYTSPYRIGDRVNIDDQKDIIGYVTGACFRYEDSHTVEVAWLHNGVNQTAWFPHWRLSCAN